MDIGHVDLNRYVNWANASIAKGKDESVVLDGNDRLTDIKSKTNALQRFFNTSAVTNRRQSVLADFGRALTERYGSIVARTVMANVGTDLTARTIIRAVSNARAVALRSALTPTNSRCLKLTDGDLVITQQTINGMSEGGRSALNRFLLANNHAARLLGHIPAGADELAAFNAEIQQVKQDLASASNEIQTAFGQLPNDLPAGACDSLRTTCQSLSERLDAHEDHVRELNENGPMSEDSTTRFRKTWREAFVKACGQLKQLFDPQSLMAGVLGRLENTSEVDFLAEFGLSKTIGESLAKRIETEMCRASGRSMTKAFAKRIKRTIQDCYQQVLNAREWTPINKTFTGTLSDQTFTLKSTIVPGKHVPSVGETYPAGVNGYMCHSAAEDKHAVNLAVSSLAVTGQDGNERKVFTGVRHGVHCAWEIKDANQRAEANRNRAREAVRGAFAAYLEAHPDQRNSQMPINLPMTSVSLLTPDLLRTALSPIKGDSNNERMMLNEQTAAWRDVDNRPMDITINGRTYHVTPRVATFNFGVNQGGVGAFSFVAGGWMSKSVALNEEAFGILRARVNSYIATPQIPLEKRQTALKLFNQVATILRDEKERSDDHDAYKAASRIAVLTSLMDGVPCWNCKSGKDRTGEMDVECKFLATLIDRGMDIPEPGQELTTEQKRLFRTIAFEGGNLEMQEYNTGIGGFKTEGVDSIAERLGGEAARTFHRGASKFVKV